jgi:hypothetical protein
MEKKEETRLTVDIPTKKYKQLKTVSAISGLSIKEIVSKLLENADYECIVSSHIPNEETLETINNIESGKNLSEIKNLKQLFKKLGV